MHRHLTNIVTSLIKKSPMRQSTNNLFIIYYAGFHVSVMFCSGLQNIHEHTKITFNCTSTKKGLVQPQADFILAFFFLFPCVFMKKSFCTLYMYLKQYLPYLSQYVKPAINLCNSNIWNTSV